MGGSLKCSLLFAGIRVVQKVPWELHEIYGQSIHHEHVFGIEQCSVIAGNSKLTAGDVILCCQIAERNNKKILSQEADSELRKRTGARESHNGKEHFVSSAPESKTSEDSDL